MGNIPAADGIFKKERDCCLQGHKRAFIVRTCYLNNPVTFLHGKCGSTVENPYSEKIRP